MEEESTLRQKLSRRSRPVPSRLLRVLLWMPRIRTRLEHGSSLHSLHERIERDLSTFSVIWASTHRYRKLPVVVIDSWDDPNVLTDDKLRKWREQLAPIFERRAEFEWRLTVGFWLGQSLLGTSATAADNQKAADWWIDARAARRRPLAILHVGPHKMASSSLQAAIASFAGTLEKDGFDTPGLASGTQRLAAAAAHLRCGGNDGNRAQNETVPTLTSSLSCGDVDAKHGWGELVHALVTARHAGRSIVLSAEDFGLPETNIETLASALHDFDVKVVVMYQPLFEWMASVHGQNAWHGWRSPRNSGQGLDHLLQCVAEYKDDDEHSLPCRELNAMDLSEVAEQYTPLVDWLTEDAVGTFLLAHTPAVLGRYALFSSVHMQTLTTNRDPNELLVDFFCNGWTPQTCALVSERGQRDKSIAFERGGEDDNEGVRALEVAIEGMRAGWLPESFSAIKATHLIIDVIREMEFQVPLRCLGVHERDVLFRSTIAAEQWLSRHAAEMFSSRTYTPDEQEIRMAFTCVHRFSNSGIPVCAHLTALKNVVQACRWYLAVLQRRRTHSQESRVAIGHCSQERTATDRWGGTLPTGPSHPGAIRGWRPPQAARACRLGTCGRLRLGGEAGRDGCALRRPSIQPLHER